MKLILLLLLCCVYPQGYAAELFGVALTGATQGKLRDAVKKAGIKLVQQSGKDTFYDVYKGDSVLHKADHLYLGFVKKDKKFAFAEYEFSGLKQPVLLNKLNKKYGLANLVKGKFITDSSYSWVSKGIQITLYQDWRAYKTRLIYFNPTALMQLRSEQKLFDIPSNQQVAVYLEKAY